MRVITLKINERTKFGKQFLNFVEFFVSEKRGVSFVEDKKEPYKSGIDLAIEDEKKGRVTSYKNSDDLFKKVLN